MKKFKLKELAKLVSGDLSGNGDAEIQSISPPDEAKTGDLVFAFDPSQLKTALSSPASGLIVEGKTSSVKALGDKPCIFVKNGRLALAKILPLFIYKKPAPKRIHKTAIIGKNVKLGKELSIGPYAVIEDDCSIGDQTVIAARVFIGEKTEIGKKVVIHPGAVIGVDGFGFAPEGEKFVKIPQIGKVVIEDEVEIYANTCIARGTLGATVIKKGTKIDNLTHVAHNCKFGENCAITALVGFAGSVEFGNHVQVGGMAGFSGHIRVGENTVVMGKAGVTKNIPPHSVISGFPAINHAKEMEIQAFMRKLPSLYKRVDALEKK